MHNALGFAGRARGVKDEQRIFGVHNLDRAVAAGGGHLGLDVHIAAINPSGLIAGVFHHKALHLVRTMQQRGIGVGFQRGAATTAGGGVGGDDNFGFGVVDPVGKRIGRETCKYDRMDRADAGACQHGIGRFGDHRQIDDNAVTFANALGPQDIGHAVHLVR